LAALWAIWFGVPPFYLAADYHFKLQTAASGPTDAFFVLGGSIRREMYVAELAKQHPETRVLISQGSEDPCILLVFQREQAPIRQVWLEKCADSTFDNFYFNIPLFNRWGVRKVKLITSTLICHEPSGWHKFCWALMGFG
jgi:uncharacterized SAM-binding protein YcdF (DUF218 family)